MEKIIIEAKEAAKKAYAPYSKFAVGVAFEFKDGTIIQGANIENASLGATSCAERTAIGISRMKELDFENIIQIAVYNKSDMIISPCGICRQVLREFIPLTTKIIMINGRNLTRETTLEELLPFSFGKEFLNV